MKIVLSWLCDFLDCSFDVINPDQLVHFFNTRVAEIESYQKVTCDTSNLFMASVQTINSDGIALQISELSKTVTLPFRSDAVISKFYLVQQRQDNFSWVKISDFSDEKEGLFPAMHHTAGWKAKIPAVDYVFEVDNKSINHRPDLWGHYGIAREVAAFLNIGLKPLDTMLATRPVVENSQELSVQLLAPQACVRIATAYCHEITMQDSRPWIAIRLARAGSKPISGVVDITNVVMFEVGHPMHAFDARSFADKKLIVRMAQAGETLELLDGQKIQLNATDLVIANTKEPVLLPGIMGGKHSGVSAQTTSLVLEAGGFDPHVIRQTAQHFKLRTESSMRFEKHLDPMQVTTALCRFLYLARELAIMGESMSPIVCVGKTIVPATCFISHEFIVKSAGVEIPSEFIIATLTRLGFQVSMQAQGGMYQVTIPTSRMTKDIAIKQDILEEIIRSYGFENIAPQLPARRIEPFSVAVVSNISKIKKHVAFALGMHEVRDYLLYDASFVASLDVDTSAAICVRNPLSQNWTTLVTSLIPHLVKGVCANAVKTEHLRFFEWNNVWHVRSDTFIEQTMLAGIIFDKKSVDFYQTKAELQSLWDLLKLDVVWQKATTNLPAWYDKHTSAQLVVDGKVIGTAGMMSTAWMHKVLTGSAFIFELDAQFLQQAGQGKQKFVQWSKYQDVSYDLSLLIPMSVTVDSLKTSIMQAHPFICEVMFVNFFEKPEWVGQRSVTFRYTVSSPEKTMTKPELEAVVQSVEKAVQKYDAQIR